MLALALHELATNAMKYGALATPQGRLEVDWRILKSESGRGRLFINWFESGFETDLEPHQGYGRELIEKALPYQLDAKTRFDLAGNRLDCSIDIAL
jgi:two-component sensor histidine kinase